MASGQERSLFLLGQRSLPFSWEDPSSGPQQTAQSLPSQSRNEPVLFSTKEQLGIELPGGEQSSTAKPRCPSRYLLAAPGRCSCRRGAWLGNSGAATPRSPWQTATAGHPYCHSNAFSESGRDPPTNVRSAQTPLAFKKLLLKPHSLLAYTLKKDLTRNPPFVSSKRIPGSGQA